MDYKTLQTIFSILGGYIGYFLGGWDGFMITLVIFVITDYITGLISAGQRKKISSEIGFVGIIKKILIFILVGIANILDLHILGQGNMIRTATIFFYISNEGISILENVSDIGLPVPKKIRKILSQIKECDDDDEES